MFLLDDCTFLNDSNIMNSGKYVFSQVKEILFSFHDRPSYYCIFISLIIYPYVKFFSLNR